jgi:hypothetical protein
MKYSPEEKNIIFKRWCNHCFNVCLSLPKKKQEEYTDEDFDFWNSFNYSDDFIYIPSLAEIEKEEVEQ